MEQIVVGYDGSEESRRAVGRAADVAEAFSARLVLVAVGKAEPEPESAGPEPGPGTSLIAPGAAVPVALAPGGVPAAPELEAEPSPRSIDLAARRLEQARSLVAGRSVDVELVSELGDTAECVLEVARGRNADLVVVGTRDRGFLERLFARPADETVARRAETDVLLVR